MNINLMTAAMLAVATPAAAQAATYTVDAKANSSTGGVGLATISLIAGQQFEISSSTDDLWSAGALPRYSDANGLVADRFATASDNSGQPVGTKIGQNFGLWTQNGFSAPYGALVGELNGVYTLLGANGRFTAGSTGTLNLYYWDGFNPDNFNAIRFGVAAVPEPATWALMILGMGAVGGAMRRRTKAAVRFA